MKQSGCGSIWLKLFNFFRSKEWHEYQKEWFPWKRETLDGWPNKIKLTLVKLNSKMIPTLLHTDESSSWILSNPNGCAHCNHHVLCANQIVSVQERPARFLGQAAAIKHSSDLGFHVFRTVILWCTVYIRSQIVQSALTNDWLMNIFPESDYILSGCFASLQFIALQCKLQLFSFVF